MIQYIYNKIASIQNSTSYFNLSKNPIEKIYRDYILEKLKGIKKYNSVSFNIIKKMREEPYKLDNFKMVGEILNKKNMIELLWVTKCNYLVKNKKLNNSFNLFNNNIELGELVGELPNNYIKNMCNNTINLCISVKDWNTCRWI